MGAHEQLRIETQQRADRLILELHGELDMATAPHWPRPSTSSPRAVRRDVVLDLRGVSFLDSTGLKAIFSARNASRERGQQLAVTPGSPQVQRLLSLTRLGEHLTVIETPDAVLV